MSLPAREVFGSTEEAAKDAVDFSALRDALAVISNKWTVVILGVLCVRPRRANEITRLVGGVARKVQTDTLRTMERDGLVARVRGGTPGAAVEYSITPLGATLRQVLVDLQAWSTTHMPQVHAARAAFDERERSAKGGHGMHTASGLPSPRNSRHR